MSPSTFSSNTMLIGEGSHEFHLNFIVTVLKALNIHLEHTWIQHPIDMIMLIFQVCRYKHIVLTRKCFSGSRFGLYVDQMVSILSTNFLVSLLTHIVT